MTTTTSSTGEPTPLVPLAPEAGEQAAARALPAIEHSVGKLRQAVLDALLDNEKPLSVAEILSHMPVGTSRNSTESAIKREFDAGRIERVAPGTYDPRSAAGNHRPRAKQRARSSEPTA
jgi:hypothetical protein